MSSTINKVFSDKHVNHGAVVGNVLLLIMYRFAYPFSVLLNKLRLSPNQITTQSLVFSILSFIALVLDEGVVWFSIFWGVSVLLDFCDGTVARMTDRVSTLAFRYDHMSDLFKISLIFLGVGIRYDNSLVWVVTSSVLFLFMYFTVLNQEVINVRKLVEKNKQLSRSKVDTSITSSKPAVVSGNRIRDRYRIIAWIVKYDSLYKAYRLLWPPLITINGHTLLLFFLFPHGPELAVWSLSYFGLIALVSIRARIAELIKTPKP